MSDQSEKQARQLKKEKKKEKKTLLSTHSLGTVSKVTDAVYTDAEIFPMPNKEMTCQVLSK